mmetsp:Transcript_26595/g.61283  ORF Transcript_26595/g.61283 Transcript_26595/m.61283 type:complete len:573 (-) Transcript_26595:259-1977(-)|eukprot:CAMPEP_0114553458 /NCGR_PEP_ID=MMETSP0114-20121206/7674_1 /TAXON_ID=31324 /ORGANISM="Goniomonas sp, Strain m" /LENGTH=572 /DNA_ID=CAMNT_0001738413 /DNA_START=63 /DNA_END=1781 /DNA_ORIENTATION=+
MGAAAGTSAGKWVQCRFEGGKGCKHEDYRRQKEESAISGLHSSWVTDDIIAMQRPTSRLLGSFPIIKEFKEQKITAVVNLQERGEHKDCGDGIHPEGFSYQTEEFHLHEIHTYNFGWQDMGTPRTDLLLDIVQVMHSIVVRGEKVAVHCHAGLGRTGLVIACFLVFSKGYEPLDAIVKTRSGRKGALQTKGQVAAVFAFCQYLVGLRVIFATDSQNAFTLENAVLRQRLLLHGQHRIDLRHTPKLVVAACHRILQLAGASRESRDAAARQMLDAGREDTGASVVAVQDLLNEHNWEPVVSSPDVVTVTRILLAWLNHLVEPPLRWTPVWGEIASDPSIIRTTVTVTPAQRDTFSAIAELLCELALPPGPLRDDLTSLLGLALFRNTHDGNPKALAAVFNIPGDASVIAAARKTRLAYARVLSATGDASPQFADDASSPDNDVEAEFHTEAPKMSMDSTDRTHFLPVAGRDAEKLRALLQQQLAEDEERRKLEADRLSDTDGGDMTDRDDRASLSRTTGASIAHTLAAAKSEPASSKAPLPPIAPKSAPLPIGEPSRPNPNRRSLKPLPPPAR